MRALSGTLSTVSVAVILLSSLVAFADESSTLLTLSNQAFTALHNATVVLPNSTSDNIQCSGTDCPCGTGSRVCDCAGASCASGDIWFNTGEKDQWQNPIYNCVMGSCQGEELVGCGTLGIVNLVQVLSPRDLPY